MPIKIGLPSNKLLTWSNPLNHLSFAKPLWLTKLTSFEYWNWMAFYGPIIPAWIYLGLKARSITFFTTVNPACSSGGFLKENKWEILKKLPSQYLPQSFNIELEDELPTSLKFPMLAKPNSGQRGIGILKITASHELEQYHAQAKESYVLQEFITAPLEFAIFYSRLPSESKGMISSITQKEFMSVIGNGYSTVKELMTEDVRYQFQIERLKSLEEQDLDRIPRRGENVLLEPLGNHCKGTKFINGNHLITEELGSVFDTIMKDVEGFYYGRFDLKVSSVEDLYKGENIKIMELNGVNSDPAHIFDPNYKLIQAYKDVYWHWNKMSQIAKINIRNGVKPLKVRTVWNTIVKKFTT